MKGLRQFLFIATLLISCTASSQSRKELTDSLAFYYGHEEFGKAVTIARKLLDSVRQESGDNQAELATALNNLAFMLNKTGEQEEAREHYLSALSIRFNIYEPDDELVHSLVQNLAVVYKETGNKKDARALYTGYLKQLREKGKINTGAAVLTHYFRGILFMESGLQNEAKNDFLAVTETGRDMLADTAVYYNSYEYLTDIFANEISIQTAEPYFQHYAELAAAVYGSESETYLYARYKLAGLYSRGKDYARSEKLIDTLMQGYGKIYGRQSREYRTLLFSKAALLGKLKRQATADSLLSNEIKQSEILNGKTSTVHEALMYDCAQTFLQAGLYERAINIFKQCITLSRSFKQPAQLAARLYTLDSAYNDLGIMEERETMLVEIIGLHEKYQLLTDSAYSIRIASLAGLYINQRNYAKASTLAEKFEQVSKKGFNGRDELYLFNRKAVANLYVIMERFDRAEKYYLELLQLAPTIWEKEDDNYIRLLRDAGDMYQDAGQLAKARGFFKQAAAILEKNQPVNYSLLADLYRNLSEINETGKENKEQEYYLRQSLQAAAKGDNADHSMIEVGRSLAYHFENGKNYEKSDSILRWLQELAGDSSKKLYNRYLVLLAQQAVNFQQWGDTVKAAGIIRDLQLKIQKFYRVEDEWDEELVLFLGEYYRRNSVFPAALELGKRMLEQQQKKLGEQNPLLASTLIIMSRLYLEARDYVNAEKVISQLNRLTLGSMLANFEVLTDQEKEGYIANKFSAQHFSNTLLLRYPGVSPEFIRETVDQSLRLKSLILSENRKITASVLQTADTSLQRIYQEWLQIRQQLARQYGLPLDKRRSGWEKLEEQSEALQKEITGRSSGLLRKQGSTTISVSDLQQNLADNEAIIEFVNFGVFREKADSALYAAYVIRKSQPVPVFVPLFEKQQLQRLLDSAGSNSSSMVSKLYRGAEIKNKSAAGFLGKELYTLIWAPLEPYLQGIQSIFYSPAGKLYNIAFHALPVDSSRILMDRYTLRQFTNSRDIIASSAGKNNTTGKHVTLFGDASFTMDSLSMLNRKKNLQESGVYFPQQRGSGAGIWPDLPGTAAEIKQLNEIFTNNKIPTEIFTATAASEENLKALSGHAPRILHIATHGFFLPEPLEDKKPGLSPKKNVYSLAADPLLRSGLILAGGNYVWSGKTALDGVEDGIVTAYEISQLNLSNTELVVLSACETALGDIRRNEGVFGLQRAFKMAGVQKMIVSLWQVPDKETAELMSAFYDYWLKGKTISEAFRQAQADMRKKYSPYYWAAFVLVE